MLFQLFARLPETRALKQRFKGKYSSKNETAHAIMDVFFEWNLLVPGFDDE